MTRMTPPRARPISPQRRTSHIEGVCLCYGFRGLRTRGGPAGASCATPKPDGPRR